MFRGAPKLTNAYRVMPRFHGLPLGGGWLFVICW